MNITIKKILENAELGLNKQALSEFAKGNNLERNKVFELVELLKTDGFLTLTLEQSNYKLTFKGHGLLKRYQYNSAFDILSLEAYKCDL
jgi:predicted transcriptional regulator